MSDLGWFFSLCPSSGLPPFKISLYTTADRCRSAEGNTGIDYYSKKSVLIYFLLCRAWRYSYFVFEFSEKLSHVFFYKIVLVKKYEFYLLHGSYTSSMVNSKILTMG